MTCIRPGDCAVCQESIRDPFGSAQAAHNPPRPDSSHTPLRKYKNACSLTPSDPEVSPSTSHPEQLAHKRQAEPRFAPESPLSAAAIPRPKSPALAEPAALSKSTDLRLTHPNPTIPLPDPIPLKIQSPISNGHIRPRPSAEPNDNATAPSPHSNETQKHVRHPRRLARALARSV